MNWSEFVAHMHELNTLSIIVRLGLASIFGALLGIDRSRKHRPAGFRTHMLVCVGAALVMITNEFLFLQYGGGDPSRLGAQVISGIGFLGAGTIIVTARNQVLGLTTAAGLWVDACMGLAIGSGFYSAAIIAGIFVLFIVIVFSGMDDVLQKTSKYLKVYVEFDSPSGLSHALSKLTSNGILVQEAEIVRARNENENIAAVISLLLPERMEHQIIVEQVGSIEGVVYAGKV